MFILNKVVKMGSANRRRYIMKNFFKAGLLSILLNLVCLNVYADDFELPDIPGGTEYSDSAISEEADHANDFFSEEPLSGEESLPPSETANTDDLNLENLQVEDATEVVEEPEAPRSELDETYGTNTSTATTGTAEAPIVNDIIIRGGFASASEIQAKMGTRKGRPLDKKILEEDFQRLYKLGQFADVQIKEEVLPDYRVNIIVLLREKNLIRRISFRGNDTIKPKKLEKEIKSQIDTRYDEGQATRDARALEEYYINKFYYFTKVTPEAEPFEDGVRLVFNIDEGHKVWVRDIVFRGNYRFTDKAIRNIIQTKQSSLFTRGKLERKNLEADIERIKLFYQSNGYLDVEVTERPFQVTQDEEYDSGWFSHDDFSSVYRYQRRRAVPCWICKLRWQQTRIRQ